ncbi:dTDP-4-dehydrorhamnose reductase [Longispora albida]|uniref:dTDP-4-dehydrorhamnose reductase n=1 Tax=Longispora albida TaxID=203523 RepID=UPI0003780030|nr:dTDP-4-dehydrorhamnose reductase [Longispora albida]
MTSCLVTGAAGMLGTDLVATLTASGYDVTGADRSALDITDAEAVRRAVAGHDIVFNAAAYTNVDGAESDEAAAVLINGTGAAIVAGAAAKAGALLIHVSTDYVLPGDSATPYAEDAGTSPINAYGRSKLIGERAVLAAGGHVVRTAWLYGDNGPNFAATMLRLAADRDTLDVVDDQHGQPTSASALAKQLTALAGAAQAGQAQPGIYHGTASGSTTWHGFARAIFELSGLDSRRIRPTTTDKFPRPARRPAYSVLGHARWAEAGLTPMAPWREALAAELARPGFLALRTAAGG